MVDDRHSRSIDELGSVAKITEPFFLHLYGSLRTSERGGFAPITELREESFFLEPIGDLRSINL